MLILAASPLPPVMRIVGIVLALGGMFFCAIAYGIGYGQARLRRRRVRTEGTIVAFDARWGRSTAVAPAPSPEGIMAQTSGGGPSYHPVVEFRTSDGETVRGTSSFGSNPRPGRVGDSAVVYYDPQDPRRVLVDTGRSRAMTGCGQTVLAAVGVILLIAGVLALVYSAG